MVCFTPTVRASVSAVLEARRRPCRACSVPVHSAKVLRTFHHDHRAFTQGLAFGSDGSFYESTGIHGQSEIRRIDPESGQVLQSLPLPFQLSTHFSQSLLRFLSFLPPPPRPPSHLVLLFFHV